MTTKEFPALPEQPEVNLDWWISERLPVSDADQFYSEALRIDPNHCRKPKERSFMAGVHEAAYGDTEILSWFFSEDEYFKTLTNPKRELLAWIFRNPQSPRNTMLNTHNAMFSFALMVAGLTEWCGYGKTYAIETLIDIQLNFPGADKSQAANDAREQKRESLKAQIFRAIGPGGKAHEFYNEKVAEKRQYKVDSDAMAKKQQ
jgi:hypothetical protein